MNELIKEARELCERATPGPWEVKLHNEEYGQRYGETTFFVDTDGTLLKIGIADAAEKYAKYNALSAFIARSRTLIPELCDALEKAERGKGCDACGLIYKLDGGSYEIDDEIIDNKFCPMCGKRLEGSP